MAANYSAKLMPGVVHLDEFVALFKAFNVSWTCDVPDDFVPGAIFETTIRFRRAFRAPEGARASLVLRYLTARLSQPGSLLTWGAAINAIDDERDLWDASCDAPLVNASVAPFLAVLNHTLRITHGAGTTALTMLVGAAPVLAFFEHLQGFQLFVDPVENGALGRNTNKVMILANGSEVTAGAYVRLECGGNVSECSSQAHLARMRRRLQAVSCATHVSQVRSGTTRGNQNCFSEPIAGYDWNYNSATGSAAVPLLPLLSGVPASQFGCANCYVHLSLALKASIDFCNPVGTVSCLSDLPSGFLTSVYLRELGESYTPYECRGSF